MRWLRRRERSSGAADRPAWLRWAKAMRVHDCMHVHVWLWVEDISAAAGHDRARRRWREELARWAGQGAHCPGWGARPEVAATCQGSGAGAEHFTRSSWPVEMEMRSWQRRLRRGLRTPSARRGPAGPCHHLVSSPCPSRPSDECQGTGPGGTLGCLAAAR